MTSVKLFTQVYSNNYQVSKHTDIYYTNRTLLKILQHFKQKKIGIELVL